MLPYYNYIVYFSLRGITMTDIIFSFDTEDFTSNIAADAILEEAKILREFGIKGGFQTVGLLAKQLSVWGRDDIREELKHHEFGFHSYGHSLHPTINEYTDLADFSAAREVLMKQEGEGVEMMKAFFGDVPIYSACPPGNSKNYVGMYSYADMGIPIYADTNCDTEDGRGVFFCNIYHIKYVTAFESITKMESDEEMRAHLDELAKLKRAIVYTHPNMANHTNFWDLVNYYKKNVNEYGKWEEAPLKTPEETALFYARMRRFIELMIADGRFNITTYSALAEKLAAESERKITRADIPAIREKLRADFGTVDAPVSLSVSDVFLACRDILAGKNEHVCGKVYGFLDEPYAVTEGVTVTADEMRSSAAELPADGFLPTEITVGGKKLGPADWLFAAMDVICGADSVTATPREQMPSLDVLPNLKKAKSMRGWVNSDEFEDKYLTKRLKLQAWTMRFLED